MYLPLLAGLCFGFWPILMRLTGLTGMQAGFMVSSVTLLVFIPLFVGDTQGFTWKTFGMALAAGLINGLGSVCLQKSLANKQLEVGTTIMIIVMTQLVVTAISSRLILGELWDLRKLAGMGSAAFTVWLLTGK